MRYKLRQRVASLRKAVKKSNRRVARRNYNSNSTNLFTGNGQLKWSPAFATETPSSGFPQFNQMNLHAMAHTQTRPHQCQTHSLFFYAFLAVWNKNTMEKYKTKLSTLIRINCKKINTKYK